MASTHIAHDCIVGNNVIMANIATLGGHVEIGEWCNIGGGAMIHQFVKIGKQSLIGGGFSAKQDVPPFIIGAGIPLRFVGINKIGLERRGFPKDVRLLIKKTYRTYFKSKINRGEALKVIKNDIPQIDFSSTPLMDTSKIMEILPHRTPFLFIDKIYELTDDLVIGV